MSATAIPVLKSLRGEQVVFTGWLSVTHAAATDKAKRFGATVNRKVTSATTVVVQGAPNTNYLYEDVGVKLDAVERLRSEGSLMYVITEDEFDALCSGVPLSRGQSRQAASGATSDVGVAFRPIPSRDSRAGARQLIIDVDALDRATRRHHQLVNRLALSVDTPLQPATPACAFDLAWFKGSTLHVAEVKTITSANEVQQIRLGLGQVLHYAAQLRSRHPRLRPHLVLETRPSDAAIIAACRRAGVDVKYFDANYSLRTIPK